MKVFSAIGLFVILFASFVTTGCSSSQESAPPSTPAAATASGAVSNDPKINTILETSCYSCHSTGGSAPWYAAISPTYLAAGAARGALNFSDWQTYDAERKAAELQSIAQSVSSGSMPPGDFTALDHSSRLSDDDKQILLSWASQAATPVAAH